MLNFSFMLSMYLSIDIIFFLFPNSFDDSNTEKLRVAARESYLDAHLFEFDPKCIDWEHYIMNTHIPGLTKHSMKR
jgi:fatty acyl-CoA reductase